MKRGPKPGRRFPIAPVEALLDGSTSKFAAAASIRKVSAARLGELLGVSRSRAVHWRSHGVTWAQADALAVAVGHHPVELWPDFYDDLETLVTS